MGTRMARAGQVEVDVPASPDQVWAVLADVTRIGEWSHECKTARWLDGAGSAAVGTRFQGANKASLIRWSRPCTITELEPARRLVYRTDGGLMGDATEWAFSLDSTESGCRIVQGYEIIRLPRAAEWLVLKMVPQHLDRSGALREDLERLGRVAAQQGSGQTPG